MPRGRPRHPDILTPREWEVLALLREGLTNPQIADRLGISENGAKYHVMEILSKLGVSSRYEAASWPQPEPAVSRRFAFLTGVFALRPPKLAALFSPKAAFAVLGGTVFGFLGLLAAGLLVMSNARPAPTPFSTPLRCRSPRPSPPYPPQPPLPPWSQLKRQP